MMNDNELLEQAKEFDNALRENMDNVKKYDIAKERILLYGIGIIVLESGKIMNLTKVLNTEQYKIVKDSIIAYIDSNLEHARNFLRCANAVNEGMKLGVMAENAVKEGKASEKPEAAEASDEPEDMPVEDEKIKKAEVSEKHTPTKEELLKDFKSGLKLCEMAKKYGYKSSSSITAMLNKYGLDKHGKPVEDKAALMEFIEGRIDEVKALYVKGPFTLKELAVEYSVDQKLLHEVLAAKGLLKSKQ